MENEMNKIDKCDPQDCSTCGADCSSRINLEDRVIQITTDDGEKISCLIMLKYVMGTKDYVAVMPLKDNPEGDIYLFRMINNRTELENIEDEDEYQKAAETFGIEMEKEQQRRREEKKKENQQAAEDQKS